MTQNDGGWISGTCSNGRPVVQQDADWAGERYEREIAVVEQTGERVIRDARESLFAGFIPQDSYERIAAAASDYVEGAKKLLADLYGITSGDAA